MGAFTALFLNQTPSHHLASPLTYSHITNLLHMVLV